MIVARSLNDVPVEAGQRPAGPARAPRRLVAAGLPAVLLAFGVAAVPFAEVGHALVGYPSRLLTAQVVGAGLAGLGVPVTRVGTSLVFADGVAHVGRLCSGVRSLWIVGLVYLAVTWLEGRPADRRWAVAGLAVAALVLVANAARVATLVVVGHVAGLPELAELMHVPLGVAAYVGCTAVAVRLARRRPGEIAPRHAARHQAAEGGPKGDRP